jgi:hypothetical protein
MNASLSMSASESTYLRSLSAYDKKICDASIVDGVNMYKSTTNANIRATTAYEK